jgi:hypothetical protein
MKKQKPSPHEVEIEIQTLKTMKPTVRKESLFGDNHHNAIDAQVLVLQRNMSEDAVDSKFVDSDDNVRSAALEAAQWLAGETDALDIGKPSNEWQSLVIK